MDCVLSPHHTTQFITKIKTELSAPASRLACLPAALLVSLDVIYLLSFEATILQ